MMNSQLSKREPTTANWGRFLADVKNYRRRAGAARDGRLPVRVAGLVLEASGIRLPVGWQCEVRMEGSPPVTAEVVGFNGDRAYLMPTGDARSYQRRARWCRWAHAGGCRLVGALRRPGGAAKTARLHLPLPVSAGLRGRRARPPDDRKGPDSAR